MGLMFLSTRQAYIVYCIKQILTDITVVRGGRLTAYVGTCADQRLLKAVAKFARERLFCNSHGYAAVFGNKVGCEVHGVIEDYSGGLGG